MLNIGGIPIWMGYIIFASGIGFIGLIVAILMVSAQEFIKECVDEIKWRHKYKHRFDKPPKAKCYCYACENYGKNGRYHDPTDNRCFAHSGWHVADDWFCKDATPCKEDPGKETKT